ncbi:hypothetical protein, partial [Evansella vedderi]|uniref:hypothetical protein n=1 Tax=Evansella vedderi TaxID=38282 RepID=UPI0027D9254D
QMICPIKSKKHFLSGRCICWSLVDKALALLFLASLAYIVFLSRRRKAATPVLPAGARMVTLRRCP